MNPCPYFRLFRPYSTKSLFKRQMLLSLTKINIDNSALNQIAKTDKICLIEDF